MNRKIAFLFPGQGSQYVQMGKDLFEQYSEAKEMFLLANEMLNFSLTSVMFEGPEKKLLETMYSQLAIYVHSLVIHKILTSRLEIVPAYVSGLSLGEYTALTASGHISFEDGLKVIQKRAELMDLACHQTSGSMIAILGLSVDVVQQTVESLGDGIWVANYNAPKQLVLAGYKEKIEEASAVFIELGAKRVVPLKVSGAFHSPLMQVAQDNLAPYLYQLNMHSSNVAFSSNVVLKTLTDSEEIRESLVNQMTAPTLWYQNCLLMDQNVDIFLELGPGKVLSGLGRTIGLKNSIITLNTPEAIEKFLIIKM